MRAPIQTLPVEIRQIILDDVLKADRRSINDMLDEERVYDHEALSDRTILLREKCAKTVSHMFSMLQLWPDLSCDIIRHLYPNISVSDEYAGNCEANIKTYTKLIETFPAILDTKDIMLSDFSAKSAETDSPYMLAEFLSQFTSTRSLECQFFDFRSVAKCKPFFFILESSTKHLSSAKLIDCILTVPQFFSFLRAVTTELDFLQLTRLKFGDFKAILGVPEEHTTLLIEEEPEIIFDFDKLSQFPSYGVPFRVKCLQLDADEPYDFALMDMLASARVFPTLEIQELVFNSWIEISPDYARRIIRLMERSKSTLHTLSFKGDAFVDKASPYAPPLQIKDLACLNLQSDVIEGKHGGVTEWVAAAIAALPPYSDLEFVHFEFRFPEADLTFAFPEKSEHCDGTWAVLDRALTAPTLFLKKITIDVGVIVPDDVRSVAAEGTKVDEKEETRLKDWILDVCLPSVKKRYFSVVPPAPR